MKKLLFLLLAFTAALPVANAEDCMHDPVYERNWNAEVTTGARLRSIPCMETSTVITTLPVGEIIKVIAETDGYYQIRRNDGTEGWVGQWLITATENTPAQPEKPNERLYDIIGHKYETAIRWMDSNGIINGYPDGSFKPDGTINRAELVKIMILTTGKMIPDFNFESIKSQYNNSCFPDISKDQWYTPYVCYAKAYNIISGYEDGNFRPDRKVSRVESLKIVLNAFNIETPNEASKNYFDDTGINEWYAPYIETAYSLGLIEEISGNYYPTRQLLRGEASNIINLAYLIPKQ